MPPGYLEKQHEKVIFILFLKASINLKCSLFSMFLPWISLLRVSNCASVLLSLASSFLKMLKNWWFICWLLIMSAAADTVLEFFEVLNSNAWSSSRSTSATQRWKRDKVSSATEVFIFQLLLVVLMSSPHTIYIPQGFFYVMDMNKKSSHEVIINGQRFLWLLFYHPSQTHDVTIFIFSWKVFLIASNLLEKNLGTFKRSLWVLVSADLVFQEWSFWVSPTVYPAVIP